MKKDKAPVIEETNAERAERVLKELGSGNLAEVAAATGTGKDVARVALKKLIKRGVVELAGDVYRPTAPAAIDEVLHVEPVPAPESGHKPGHNGHKAKDQKVKVLWVDHKYYGSTTLKASELPPEAIGVESRRNGDWIYILERTHDNGTVGYKPFPIRVMGDPKREIPPSRAHRATGFISYARLFRNKVPANEGLQKGLLIGFVVCALIFTFLLVVVLMGGDSGGTP